jgi:hypothetical protein
MVIPRLPHVLGHCMFGSIRASSSLSWRPRMTEKSRGSVRVEPRAKRVRAYLNGELVADTRRPFLVWERPYYRRTTCPRPTCAPR